ncbi:polysaccharide lyase family 7 protein [Pseudoalteromonas sp. S1727]|uniref:polysaccharide lyase family 7 protein n=1 Tax=Pseudoalteromonas sp. S1727 TaxID=2066514 RepID=UPI001486CD11|nr:polysaccharide lyase family 7 protein [Pseudoalteromonas sp. S1727]
MRFIRLFCSILVCTLLFGLVGCDSSTPSSVNTSNNNGNAVENEFDELENQWINFDFSAPVTLSAVHLVFYKGDERTTYFKFESSNNNQDWTTLLDTGSSANTTQFESFYLANNVTARYFRIVDLGDSNETANNITHIKFTSETDEGALVIPGLIEAENYTSSYDSTPGNQGGELREGDVDIWQTTDSSGSYSIGSITDEEWLEYEINVGSSGQYTANLRIASVTGSGSIRLLIDGIKKTDFIVPATTQWETKSVDLGILTTGVHTLKLAMTDGDFELNWIDLYKNTAQLTALNPNVAPSANFDLTDWYLGVPIDENGDGKSDSISETRLAAGYEHPQWFYTGSDGAMVFKVEIDAPKTSTNTSYSRSELREMLRAGDTSISTQGINKNNWVFSSYSTEDKNAAGGIDGELTATLKVDHVTTTGDSSQVGRVIIGQIHAKDDEPARLYYRKLSGHSKGSIYLAHEPSGGSDQIYDLIGTSSSSAANPNDGIELGEIFSYSIKVTGNTLLVTIMRDGKPDVTQKVDMSKSGYHTGDDQYMYFKAGVYNQNNIGDANDYVQASFYSLSNSHN